jgi:hypothetical protein
VALGETKGFPGVRASRSWAMPVSLAIAAERRDDLRMRVGVRISGKLVSLMMAILDCVGAGLPASAGSRPRAAVKDR